MNFPWLLHHSSCALSEPLHSGVKDFFLYVLWLYSTGLLAWKLGWWQCIRNWPNGGWQYVALGNCWQGWVRCKKQGRCMKMVVRLCLVRITIFGSLVSSTVLLQHFQNVHVPWDFLQIGTSHIWTEMADFDSIHGLSNMHGQCWRTWMATTAKARNFNKVHSDLLHGWAVLEAWEGNTYC